MPEAALPPGPVRRHRVLFLLRILLAVAITFCFLTSVKIIGESFEMASRTWAEGLIVRVSHPIVGVLVGVLFTSLVQSSSATTSLLVGMVAAGTMPVRMAIPVVMGANIGTTVTNTLVALGHVTRRTEFRRAISCSTMHDFFNLMAVAVILPIEYFTHFLEHSGQFLAGLFADVTEFNAPKSFLKQAMKPFVEAAINLFSRLDEPWGGILMGAAGAVILFVSLWLLTKTLKSLTLGRVEQSLHNYLDRHGPVGILVGAGATAAVQSSSVTTSFMVPICAAGVLKPRHVYPVVLGANIGTTFTALIAAIGAGEVAGLTLAFTHLLFNLCGLLIFYPIPKLRIPIWLANRFARIVFRRRWIGIAYVLTAFYGVPLLAIFLAG